MKKTLIISLIIALSFICALWYSYSKLSRENVIYAQNQKAFISGIEYYKTENDKNAASVQRLTLSYDELKDNYDKVVATSKDLGIKLKRIQSTSTTATRTDVKVVTVVKDSIVYRNGKADSLKCFAWEDPWTDVQGAIAKDSVDLNIQSRDTIIQIVHRIPHKFWFIKWGTKAIRQEIVSSNPHTNITYTEYIELKK